MSSTCPNTEVSVRAYQRAPGEWLLRHRAQHGMIIEYGTGTGKGLTAVYAASLLLSKGRVNRVVVVTPKSLQANFRKAIRLCGVSESSFELYTYDTYRLRGVRMTRDTLLIIDEAHNLRNTHTLRSKTLLRACVAAGHVLLLTATPLVNRVDDMWVLLRGVRPSSKVSLDQLQRAKKSDYVRFFRDHVAVYHGKLNKPEVKIVERRVALSESQVQVIRGIMLEMLSPEERALLLDSLERGVTVTYGQLKAFLTRVRQLSNVLEHDKCSPKVRELVSTAMSGPKPVVIYSQFLKFGVENVARCLKRRGVSASRIHFFHGGKSAKVRAATVRAYNEGQVDYLMVSQAGSEGISLRGTRQVHILEPYWNNGKIEQTMARGIRLDSHLHLPKSERHVMVFRWLSILRAPASQKKKKREPSFWSRLWGTSTEEEESFDELVAPDVLLTQMSERKSREIARYLRWNRAASIRIPS